MTTITRRAILAGTPAAVAAAAILPLPIACSLTETDPVVLLVDRWRVLNAQMIELCRPTGFACASPGALDHEDAIADLNDLMIEVEGEIAATAATSFAGLHAKLIVAACETGTPGPTIAQAYAGRASEADHLTASAWADAERLAGKGGVI
jgi:hypothetical protein